jgi:cytochrome c-type biogenesis protein
MRPNAADRQHMADGHTDRSVSVPVHGMTCDGCANTVRLGLGSLDGVTRVDVDVDQGRAVVSGAPDLLDEAALRSRVIDLGYAVTDAAAPDGPARSGMPAWKVAALVAAAAAIVAGGTLVFRTASDAYLVAETLQRLNALFAEASLAGIGLALLFGVIVAFAPSTYAMAPAVMGYVTGAKTTSTRQAATLAGAFVGGVVAVDMAVGAVFAVGGAAAMRFFTARLPLWYVIITLALVVMGLINLRVWRPALPSFLPRLRDAHGPGGAFAVGVPFGLMACPSCTPLLLPVALGAAATGDPWYGAALMGAFAVGRGVPLVAVGTFTGLFHGGRRFARWVPRIERAVGVLLLVGAAWFLREFFRAGGIGGLL